MKQPMTLKCEPIECNLVGVDGNAFALMGTWQQKARRQGRSQEEIEAVLEEAKSGDYDHLVFTLSEHCVMPEGVGEEDEYEFPE